MGYFKIEGVSEDIKNFLINLKKIGEYTSKKKKELYILTTEICLYLEKEHKKMKSKIESKNLDKEENSKYIKKGDIERNIQRLCKTILEIIFDKHFSERHKEKEINKLLPKLIQFLHIEVNQNIKKDIFDTREKFMKILLNSYRDKRFSKEEVDKILLAVNFLFEKQLHILRKNGRGEVTHSLEISLKLMEEVKTEDPNLIIAAILHDVLENTNTNEKEIEEKFGEEVCSIVKKLTNKKKKFLKNFLYKKRVLKHMEDEKFFIIKFHDLEHNLSDFDNINIEQKINIAKKYFPIVNHFYKKLKDMKNSKEDKDHLNYFLEKINWLVKIKAKLKKFSKMKITSKEKTSPIKDYLKRHSN